MNFGEFWLLSLPCFAREICKFISKELLSPEFFSDDGLWASDAEDRVGVEKLSLEEVVRLDDDGVDTLPDPIAHSYPLSRLITKLFGIGYNYLS